MGIHIGQGLIIRFITRSIEYLTVVLGEFDQNSLCCHRVKRKKTSQNKLQSCRTEARSYMITVIGNSSLYLFLIDEDASFATRYYSFDTSLQDFFVRHQITSFNNPHYEDNKSQPPPLEYLRSWLKLFIHLLVPVYTMTRNLLQIPPL